MAENFRNRVLDHWRARHTDIAALKEELERLRQRLADLEETVAELRRERSDRAAGQAPAS
jgi:polyhydroxyalkanoate synthesis regulator phasin